MNPTFKSDDDQEADQSPQWLTLPPPPPTEQDLSQHGMQISTDSPGDEVSLEDSQGDVDAETSPAEPGEHSGVGEHSGEAVAASDTDLDLNSQPSETVMESAQAESPEEERDTPAGQSAGSEPSQNSELGQNSEPGQQSGFSEENEDSEDSEHNDDSGHSEAVKLTPAQIDRQERLAAKAQRRAEKQARREQARQAVALEKAQHRQRHESHHNHAQDFDSQIPDEYAQVPQARRVKMTLARINPLSAMKIGFLAAVGLFLIMLVASIVLWLVLDMLHVFSSMSTFIEAVGATAIVNLMDVLQFSRAIALVAIFGVFQIMIFTVLSWLFAVIYNLIARMVGGLHIVLTDE